jgi:FADH2 O2-dependent halogenase
MWVLRFGNGVTSAGVAMSDLLAEELRLRDGAPAWSRLLARYPSIASQFADATPVREFTWIPRLSWRASSTAGERWARLPSAAAFVDPLFSSGMPMTLLGVERLGRMLEAGVFLGGTSHRTGQSNTPAWSVDDYSRVTLAEADHTARFIGGCYAAFPRFADFSAYAQFYFAAASYAEMSRRLAGASVAAPACPEFLRAGDPAFAGALACLSPARAAKAPLRPDTTYFSDVAAAVDRVNIAGLCDPAKRNWYPVDASDALSGASKLGVTPDRVRDLLVRQGLVAGL